MDFYSKSKFCTIVLVMGCLLVLQSQNLVKNPSFETFLSCPKALGNFDADVIFWSTPTEGSTDYFNACSEAMGTPKNFNGTQPADFGKGYAGLYLYAPDDYREYLQAELSEPLIPGKNYAVSFYVSLAERSDFAIKEFGVLFSSNELSLATKKELSKKMRYEAKENDYQYMEIGYTNFYSDTKDWILVHTQFIAKGTERYLILGNFKTNARTRMFRTKKNAKQGAYYYVDMVSVVLDDPPRETSELVAIADGKETKNIELDKSYIFKDVLFEFDRSSLLEPSKEELQNVYDHLKANAMLHILINGHTDDKGSEDYNQYLSSNRAKTVADYLIRLGLPEQRINWSGHGSTKPIADNSSEKGRQKNRRVEFVITKRL
ncbi:OmpA family protein [Maribacter halichondriae]|uniref:OmpA family protein n=1 Tax=Maribacter halichondriae TaxID=2980554 RepID=UPI0023581292|nr:OmpA family protein [Maribacter sp. Hal144]